MDNKIDKALVFAMAGVLLSAGGAILTFLGGRIENQNVANMLPDYSSVKEITIKKES